MGLFIFQGVKNFFHMLFQGAVILQFQVIGNHIHGDVA